MKTTEVPPGVATASINAQIRSLEARINELSNEIKALEAKIEAQEKSQAKEAEKNAAKLKDPENQIENPKNEEDDADTELTKWQDALVERLMELDPYDEFREGGEVEKRLEDLDRRLDEMDFSKPPPPRKNLFDKKMLRWP